MFGSFLPSLRSSNSHSLLGSRSRHCYAIKCFWSESTAESGSFQAQFAELFFFARRQFPALVVTEEFLKLTVMLHRHKRQRPCSSLQGSVFCAFLGQGLRNLFQLSRLFFVFIKVRCHVRSPTKG